MTTEEEVIDTVVRVGRVIMRRLEWIVLLLAVIMILIVVNGCAFHARGTPGPRLLEAQYSYSERVPEGTPGAIAAQGGWFKEGLKPWSNTELVAAGLALGCMAVDLVTTHVSSPGTEVNPVNAGSSGNPKWAVILPIHIALPAFAWWHGERTGRRTLSWGGIMLAECAISAWNLAQLK